MNKKTYKAGGYRQQERTLPLTQVAGFLPIIRLLERRGVPVQRYLAQANIPLDLLEYPHAAIPSNLVYRFAELVCRAEDMPHMGLEAGLQASLNDLGPYGRVLQSSLTVYDYLRQGIRLINMTSTSQRFWLTDHGNEVRLHIWTNGYSPLGQQQAELYSLIITINELRKAAGAGWSPRQLSLTDISPRKLPDIEALAETNIAMGCGESFFTLPQSMLELPFSKPHAVRESTSGTDQQKYKFLPITFIDSIEYTIEAFLLHNGYPSIDIMAEAAGISRRSLQRKLAQQNLAYSQLVKDTRIRLAARWLETSDTTVTDISNALGYNDMSNFIRAFRQRTGVSPQAYRNTH